MMDTIDLFCGAGGTSIGAHLTGGVKIKLALNHWHRAIETHSLNFQNVRHINSRIEDASPSEADSCNLLFASPECIHFSKARGARPTSDQQRVGANHVLPWIEHHRPEYVVIENVTEFLDWGPVHRIGERVGRPIIARKGQYFRKWSASIKDLGYTLDWRTLNAADFGAATSRNRLFVIARRGRRKPRWPKPSHANDGGGLPLFADGGGLPAWRGAIEIIDWSIPLLSVFARTRPLADKTLARIQKGLDRYVAPFVVTLRNHGEASDPDRPIGTITAGGLHHGVTLPFVTKYNGNTAQGDFRNHPMDEALRTLDTSNRFGVVAPFIATVNHGYSGGSRTRSVDSHLPTITTRRGEAIAAPFILSAGGCEITPRDGGRPTPTILTRQGQAIAVPIIMSSQYGGGVKDPGTSPVPTITTKTGSQIAVPFITTFNGTFQAGAGPEGSPLPTITTVERHAATLAALGIPSLPTPRSAAERRLQDRMKELGVLEIGFRMLSNEELANAQGFPADYRFTGPKKDVTKMIGNSVSPPVAKAITESILGTV